MAAASVSTIAATLAARPCAAAGAKQSLLPRLAAVGYFCSRRSLLRLGLAALGAGVACTARVSRFAALSATPDANGFLLPPGFTSRVIARSGDVVAGTQYVFPNKPDGAGVVPRTDGGWWLLWNGEGADGTGGVAALRFDRAGSVVAAHGVLTGLNRACAGGVTPWGTWLACEEVGRGAVWEADPSGAESVQHLGMGRFRHEAAAVDGARRVVYLSEDEPDGLFYRYRYTSAGLASGVLEAAAVDGGGAVTWLAIPDPSAASAQCRAQVPATRFDGGEGLCIMDGRTVFLTTKGDDRVWRYNVLTERMDVVYRPLPGSSLRGVDNIAVSPGRDLLVCEDGDNMEVVAVDMSGRATPLLRLSGQQNSELTGVNLSPDGRRLYVGSQRAMSSERGIVYEMNGPFPW